MKIATLITLAIISVILSACVRADYCAESKIIERDFDASAFNELKIRALAGELEITPSTDDKIRFWGKVCTDEKQYLDMIDLNVVKSDSNLTLSTIIPYHLDDFDPGYATMDIELSIPVGLPTRLRDSSGNILVEGVSVMQIDDSSGDIRVFNGKTNLTIRDSSGQILIRGLTGDVKITDSSGNIDLFDIQGSVSIPGDSSGDIDIKNVTGAVEIDRDSSGDIDIGVVGQDVIIGRDGSGDIEIKEVRGMVRIGADGSGRIFVGDVAGNLTLDHKGSGDISTYRIEGEIDLPR